MPGWRRIFTAERVALFLLILAAALPYLSSLTFGFVYDDLGVIVEVPVRHTWLGVAQAWVQSYWGNPETGLYRLVAQFMYALLWNLGGGQPWLFHLYAIVIHVATTLGLWWLLARAGHGSATGSASGTQRSTATAQHFSSGSLLTGSSAESVR